MFFRCMNLLTEPVKGIVHLKKENSVINIHPHPIFTFVQFQNTNEDFYDEIWEISAPPLTQLLLTLQKVHQDTVKLIQINSAVLSKFSEETQFIKASFKISKLKWLLRSCQWRSINCSRFHQKDLHLCSEDEPKSYGFVMTWGWIKMTQFSFWGELSL